MKPIKVYHRDTPEWFTPYRLDMDIKEPYNIHVWHAAYMWLFYTRIVFFWRRRKSSFMSIGDTL